MASQLTFTTTGAITASNTFKPQTNFVIVAMQATDLTGVYQLQVRPSNSTSNVWVDFPSEPAMLQTTGKVLAAEGSPDFEYRFHLESGTADGNIFYWGHVTNLQSIYS